LVRDLQVLLADAPRRFFLRTGTFCCTLWGEEVRVGFVRSLLCFKRKGPRNAHGLPRGESGVDPVFAARLAAGPVRLLFGRHVPGSLDRQVLKAILRHEGLGRRTLRDIA
jgi:hypothetical protein